MFHCSNCGYKSIKWLGKCPLCEGWETFAKETVVADDKVLTKEKIPPQLLKDIESGSYRRTLTGIDEFDRIIGGGTVTGEIILVGGEPGVGKSTLLLEVAAALSKNSKTLYVSAEESPEQIALRAKRLSSNFDNLYIVGEDNLEEVLAYVETQDFKFLIVDSIQVVYSSRYEGSKGTVSQIRGCADYLTQIAKSKGIVIFVVGHVTKEGVIAGPKLLEHIVDCVLYFEGELLSCYRILRASKNRFGPTGEIAVFEMSSEGLREVKKVTDFFLPHNEHPISGSCAVCVIEGLRPIFIELQALVSKASFGVVRRRSLGFDFNRFSLLIAIIEKRLKSALGSEDIFLNVAGGIKINDPSADLGAIVAILSSFNDKKVSQGDIFIGEVGLGGELRRVSNINLRLKEVERTGFKRCFIPQANLKDINKGFSFKIEALDSLSDLMGKVF